MKSKNKILVALCATALMSLASCSITISGYTTLTSESTSSATASHVTSSATTSKTSSSSTVVSHDTSGYTAFRSRFASYYGCSSPSTGNVRAFVVPVVFADNASSIKNSTSTQTTMKNQIQKTFFGTASENGYWESLNSFYEKSSYGKMNITGTVSDFLYTSYTVAQADKAGSSNFTNMIINQAVNNYFVNGDYKVSDYDSDGDGYIDLFWLVYDQNYSSNSNLLWAFTSWADNDYVCNYSWASYKFCFEQSPTNGGDAHTFIHETGHQLGLDDYYSYDSVVVDAKTQKTGLPRSPMGYFDMMDGNVGDHNSFSKYDLGWTTPTVGAGGKTYTLKPFEDSGDTVLIGSSLNGGVFDEYFLLQYYTPTGLNENDVNTAYTSVYGKMPSGSGLRIIHVDQRVGKYVHSSSGWSWNGSYYDGTDFSNGVYATISSNTKSYCLDSQDYALCSIVQANGDTNLMEEVTHEATVADIPFVETDNDDLFNLTSNVFGKDVWGTSVKTNEGWTVPVQVNITAMDSTGVTFSLVSNS